MILTYKDHQELKKVDNLLDTKENAERQILNVIKDYRYKDIGQKLLNKLIKHFLKNDKITHKPYEYHSKWYKGEPYNSFMDFFTRKLKNKKNKEIKEYAKTCSMVIPCESWIEGMGDFKNSKKIVRLKKDSSSILKELQKFDINIPTYNYIDMKLLVTYYHRVHMPVNGKIKKMIPVEGKDDFFGNNSLWILEIETKKSPIYLFLVGESTIQDFCMTVQKNEPLNIFDEIGFFNWGSQTLIFYNPDSYQDICIEEKNTYFAGDCIFK